jgi:hypothetical protein
MCEKREALDRNLNVAGATRRRRLGTLLRERRSVTALEFGLVGPMFVLGVLALFEFAFLFMAQLMLDGATQAVARQLQIGAAQAQLTTALFNSNVTCAAFIYLDCTKVYTNIQQVTDYYNNGGLGAGFTLTFRTVNGNVVGNNVVCGAEPAKMFQIDMIYPAPVLLFKWLPQTMIWANGATVFPVQSTAAFGTEAFTMPNGLAGC